MRGPKPPPLELSVRQHELLHRLTRRHSAPQQLICRVQVILLAAAGHSNSRISQHLALDRTHVRLWRHRWVAAAPRLAALEATAPDDPALTQALTDLLADAPRPGTPPKFSPEQVVQLVALACEDPADSGRPISSWTPRELADEAMQRGIVESISARSVGRLLKCSRFKAASDPLLAARTAGRSDRVRGTGAHRLRLVRASPGIGTSRHPSVEHR